MNKKLAFKIGDKVVLKGFGAEAEIERLCFDNHYIKRIGETETKIIFTGYLLDKSVSSIVVTEDMIEAAS